MIASRCEKGHATAADGSCTTCMRQREGRAHSLRGEVLHLDPKPFALWLRKLAQKEGIDPVARRLGIPVERARRLVNGRQKMVHIDTVDQALCREGNTHLRQVYPQLYDSLLGRRGWRARQPFPPEDE